MARADQYRVKAAEFHAKAAEETRPFMRRSLEILALVYVRLAEQADRNALTDVAYGPIVLPIVSESDQSPQ
jgi:hypothetical protein